MGGPTMWIVLVAGEQSKKRLPTCIDVRRTSSCPVILS